MSSRVVITGTSSGIGLDTAVLLAESGFEVIATMRNLDKCGPLEASAKEKGINLEIRRLDVADVNSIETCLDEIRSDLGPIDALVNNAGFGRLGSVEQLDQAAVEQVMAPIFTASGMQRAPSSGNAQAWSRTNRDGHEHWRPDRPTL